MAAAYRDIKLMHQQQQHIQQTINNIQLMAKLYINWK